MAPDGAVVRIPLTIVAPLGKTDGVIVAVMVTDLDALEAENERLREWQKNACHFIESSLRIAERSCNPGDGLDGTWADRLLREAGAGGSHD